MSKIKYYYNTKTLQYEKVVFRLKDFLLRLLYVSIAGLVFSAIVIYFAYSYFNSPKEKQLIRELDYMKLNYTILNDRLDQLNKVLEDLERRDDNIYRAIFEAEPIPKEVRRAGFGGVNRYEKLKGYENSEIVSSLTQKIDILSKQIVIQSKSFDQVILMAKNKSELLAAIPAIVPISLSDLNYMASGFGYRTDPIYKTVKFHAGMDFVAPIGTPVYATGNGVILRADDEATGYGKHVRINHGYGYITLYAHLSEVKVKPGQKVKRGDVIGLVGSTGKSVGPHLHYEVHKNGVPVNPVNFYFNDLSPEEYEMMIHLSETPTQSLD